MKISQEILLALTERLETAFLPPPKRKLWEWAEDNVILTPKTGTFSPGRYRTRHTPHVREVMEEFQNPDSHEIVLVWAAQTAKTLTETICTAWSIANDPGNTLIVMPSEQMAKSFSTSRLQRVIEDTPCVASHKITGRGTFNKLEMELDNCVIALTGAGSASNLASRPIRRAILDELDKYPPALGDEGSPAVLAVERTKTFPNYKVMKSSTVTVETGPIWVDFIDTDQREWHCRCPKCGHEFIPNWKLIEFDQEGSVDDRAETVRLVCPECGRHITNRERIRFLSAGRWKPTAEGKKGRVGFRISELCSCIGRPWPDLVRAFIKASSAAKNGNPADLKSFVCSVLSEPWRVNSDTMRNADEFLQYCDGYPAGIVPTYLPVSGLTIGIDTQDNGFYYVVRAWGGGESLESWLVECGFAEDLSGLERAVFHEYQGEDGKVYKIKGGFIDAMGHRTADIYNWCRTVGFLSKIIPTKGERDISGGSQFSYTAVDKDRRGKPRIGGLQLVRVNTTIFKDWLDGKLRVPQEDMGAWHINDDAPEDYRLQMTSEYRDENGVWQPRSHHLANHYWDCEVLALARAASLHLDKSTTNNKEGDFVEVVPTKRRRW